MPVPPKKEKRLASWARWLMPATLATQEAYAGGLQIRGQHGQS
jgi:hypothetical protein